MKDYQLRVVEEKRELDKKIEKLDAFLQNHDTPVSEDELSRMQRQLSVMEVYSAILQSRIANFEA